ncbi:PorP/SprF family type IX secretion system membrane protein [Flavobacteriaceae bacterium]|nr:PorP/SprF family type IX secretion system membrane protein [Flavobacteriaceae bacterium]
MKKYLFYILITLGQSLFSQESSLIFNKFNLSIFNPAYVGVDGSAINLNTRVQWLGIEDGPMTNYLIIHLPERRNASLGFTVQNDRVFVENKSQVTLDYSYKLQLSNSSYLSLGLKAGGRFFNIDINNVPRIFSEANQSISEPGSYFSPILGAGVSYISKKGFLGVAVPGLLNSTALNKNQDWELTSRDYTYLHLSGGIYLNLSDKFSVNPSLIYRSNPRQPDLINSIIEMDYNDRFSLGSVYTNNNTLAFFFKLKSKKGFHIGYGYESSSGSDGMVIRNSTHEVMLRLELKSKKSEEIDNNLETQENE